MLERSVMKVIHLLKHQVDTSTENIKWKYKYLYGLLRAEKSEQWLILKNQNITSILNR